MYQFYKNLSVCLNAHIVPLITVIPVLLLSSPVMSDEKSDVSHALVSNPVGLSSLLQILTGLVFIVMLIMGAAWMLRRYGNFNGVANGELKIIAGLSLGQREKIVIIKAGEEQLLIGVAPGFVKTLHVLDKPIKEVSGSQSTDSFLVRLKDEMKKRNKI